MLLYQIVHIIYRRRESNEQLLLLEWYIIVSGNNKHTTCTAQKDCACVLAYMRCCSLVADLRGPVCSVGWQAGKQCLMPSNRIYRRRYSNGQLLVVHYSRRG